MYLFFIIVELLKTHIFLLMHQSIPANSYAIFYRRMRDFDNLCRSRGVNENLERVEVVLLR